MERQWDADTRSPEFACIQRAWKTNIAGLWTQICNYVNNHGNLLSIFEESSYLGPSSSSTAVATASEAQDPPPSLTLQDDFTHSNMVDVFINYSSKTTSQLAPVEEETPIELDSFLSNANAMQREKETEDIPYLTNTEMKKKPMKKKVAITMPSDFRHYKYLPV